MAHPFRRPRAARGKAVRHVGAAGLFAIDLTTLDFFLGRDASGRRPNLR